MQLTTDKFYEILNTTWDTGPLQTAIRIGGDLK